MELFYIPCILLYRTSQIYFKLTDLSEIINVSHIYQGSLLVFSYIARSSIMYEQMYRSTYSVFCHFMYCWSQYWSTIIYIYL